MTSYKIVYDTSSDRHTAKRMSITRSADQLAKSITSLQARGYVIVEISQES